MLRDYHVDNHARNFLGHIVFYFAIKNFALCFSQQWVIFDKCHLLIKIFLTLGTDGLYCVKPRSNGNDS